MDWLSLPDLIELPNLLAQTPSLLPKPSPSPSPADIELLKSQLEFLKQSHNQFADSMKQFVDGMKQFVDAIKVIFTVLGIVLGIGGGFAAFFLGKSFKDFQDFSRREIQDATQNFKDFQELARRDIKDFQEFARREVQDSVQRVRQEAEVQIPHLIETEVGELVRTEVTSVERMLRREQVIKSTRVDYYLLDADSRPNEIKFLEARNFNQVRFRDDFQAIKRDPGDVVVLDLQNWATPSGQKFSELSEKEQQEPGKEQIDSLLNLIKSGELSSSTVIVVYIRGRIFYINEITEQYVIAANNPVTLVGNVVDGAYVVVGDRRARNA